MKMMRPVAVKYADLLSSNVAETAALYNPLTNYAVDAVVRANTVDGTFEFQSLVTPNQGNPVTDPTKWAALGPSNRWKALDGKITVQTTNPDSVVYQVKMTAPIDGVSVLNASCAEVRLQAVDVTDGTVFDQTVSMIATYGIVDLFEYLSEPIELSSKVFIGGISPLYNALTITVTISAPGATAKVGEVIPSFSREIGGTAWGAKVGIVDYSKKAKDDFGNDVVIGRAFSDTADFTIHVDNGVVDQVKDLFARYRATPIVWLGNAQYRSTLVYGWCPEFQVEIEGPKVSVCTARIEGLAQQ